METRSLGRTGIEVSVLGFGCGAVGGLMVRGDQNEQVRSIARALEAGVNYFDTAPSYGDGSSEQNLGRALHELGVHDRVVVGTKVRLGTAELSEPVTAIRRSLGASLGRLGLDHVHVVHLHNPIGVETPNPTDPGVPTRAALEEVADGLQRMVEEGLARHVGFTGVGAAESLKRLAASPAYETVQAYFNVLDPSGLRAGVAGGQQDFEGLIPHAEEHGVGVIAIRVYAAGALSGRPERHPLAWLPPRPLVPGSDYDADVERARRLERTAAELGLQSVLELGLRFALTAPGVSTALVGLSGFEHLEAAIRWGERGRLRPDQFRLLLEMAEGG
ncbi:MAG TPA: aldo/keto reductase [Candidatus Dormibacteraeota bacterium]|nr:aldo/keto reductase [Candidatus Dormibacteraeota bacterium]